MTIPGIEPLTAAAFVTVVDDPSKFAKSRSVVACLGLTPRRDQSGQRDHKELAADLGLTHEALYRTLCKMEADGEIKRADGMIKIKRGI